MSSSVRSVPLRCRCGALRGEVEVGPGTGQRIVCYCDDCQALARFLERDDVLDAHGGSDIFQTRPAGVRITEGADQLACMRLSEKGMHRFYARCCRTPIANTLGARAPFVGLASTALDPGARESALGPPIARVQGRFAIGGVPAGAHPTVGPGLIARTFAFLARGFLTGSHAPSPFFDARTKQPRVTPEVLTPTRRDALRSTA